MQFGDIWCGAGGEAGRVMQIKLWNVISTVYHA